MQIKSLFKKFLLWCAIILSIILIITSAIYFFFRTHFLWGTTIDGLDCSLMSIEKATYEINLARQNEIVTFIFSNGDSYSLSYSELGIHVDDNKMVEIFKHQRSDLNASREYSLNGFFVLDENVLTEFLAPLPAFEKENMIERQNAYIIWNEESFLIQEEVYGNVIYFDEATNFAIETIRNGEKNVDFTKVTEIVPDVLKSDLIDECEWLNAGLNTSINFELENGEIITLDSNIIKSWIYQDESGKFIIDTENGINSFVMNLAVRIDELNDNMYFIPSESENMVAVNISEEFRAYLDVNAQISEIKELLGNPEPIFKKPIYTQNLMSERLTSYVEIDLTRQHIWVYKDSELVVSTPCVTGNVNTGYATPPGVFFLIEKARDVYLEDYNSDGSMYSTFVEYWMRFNRGIGMHDASWRYEFGDTIYTYAGSHGCVNMPPEAAAMTYEVIDYAMPIIVYNS